MHRTIPQSFLIACILAGVLSAQPRLIKGPIQDSQRARMTGHVHPMAKAENDLGPLDASVTLPAITLVLQQTPAQQADLESLLAAQQDPSSADYHRWLTPEQYADRFGASPDDIAKITAWLEQHNLHVTTVGRARTSVIFTGTAGDVAQALEISFHRYSVDGVTHFANTAEPSLPIALQTAVRAIHGLHDFRMQPKAVLRQTLDPNYTSGTGNHYLSPDDFGTIYNLKALWSAGYNGTGQKIVIAGQTDVALSDIQKFRTRFLLPAADPQMILVPQLGDPGTVSGDLGEADLDLEWSGATAPNATLIYAYSPNVMDAVLYAIDQNLAPVLSLSYGACEPQSALSDMQTMQSWAQQANAQGMTWVNAAGDSGGDDCYTVSSSGTASGSTGLSVDSPADIPEVTGIGGTTLSEGSGQYWNDTNSANGGSAISYIPEMVWNDSSPGNPAAGGGGASTVFLNPAWQTGLGVPNNGARNVPDIALAASPNNDGYMVYTSDCAPGTRTCPPNSLAVFGGTSGGTPSFAGIVALLNQYLVSTKAQTTPGVGNVNPRLYSLAQAGTGAFHDVTIGNNIVTATCGARSRNCVAGSFGYPAGQGYDQASGLGSVNAFNLVTGWRTTTSARASASVALQATATSVVSNGSVTITAIVTGSSGATPTGVVTFTSGGQQIGAASLSGTGSSASASITVAADVLQVGTNNIVAQYSGDATLNGATGTIGISVTPSGPPAIGGLANGASFGQAYAPGAVLTIFGSNLGNATWVASTVPLPGQVSGFSVTIAGVNAPLYYVSPTQLNVQIPYETPVNQPSVVTINNNGRTATTTLTVASAAPGLFTDQYGNGTIVPTATVARGGVLTLYLTGVGAVSPAMATGAAPAAGTPIALLPVPVQATTVTIGGVPTGAGSILFDGIPTTLVGVAQINLRIPATAPLGAQPIVVAIGGAPSAPATIFVTAK
jgi:uncharacterized protein (TIGR03437 family)